MANKQYRETTFGSAHALPIDKVTEAFLKAGQIGLSEQVVAVAEAPLRASKAAARLWLAVGALFALVAYALAAAFSIWTWSWLAGIGLSFLGLVFLFNGARYYYSLTTLNELAHLFFMSGKNLVPLVENKWHQDTAALRYAVFNGQFTCQFILRNLATKPGDDSPSIPVDLVVHCALSFHEQRVAGWLREIEAEAMRASAHPMQLLEARLSRFPDSIRNQLSQALGPVVASVTYPELREQAASLFGQGNSQLAKAIAALFEAEGVLVFQVLNLENILPPADVSEQEERLLVRQAQERALGDELQGRVENVEWEELSALCAEIGRVDINAQARANLLSRLCARAIALGREYFGQKIAAATVADEIFLVKEINDSDLPVDLTKELQDALSRRIGQIKEQAQARHANQVEDRVDDLDVEADALLQLTDPEGPFELKLKMLAERRERNPELVEAALLVRQSASPPTNRALPGRQPAMTSGNRPNQKKLPGMSGC